MDYKEISAKTVNEAITQACVELGVTSDHLDYEVLSEGSKGFLGFGSKQAVIRYRILEEEEPAEEIIEKETADKPVPAKKKERKEEAVKENSEKTQTEKNNADRPKKERKDRGKNNRSRKEKQTVKEKKETAKEQVRENKKAEEPVERAEEEIAVMKEAAAEFLTKVFAAMDLPVSIKSEYEPADNCLNVELSGDDMGVLIGKRGQTLDSLQYLTSLCVNKNIKEYVRIKIDTEDYRRRRKETLENLAKNIASKVKKTRKTVVLEPMNPYERRIIHSALQPNPYVETYSEGNEPYRHVVVTLKK